jgi:cell division protein ZapA
MEQIEARILDREYKLAVNAEEKDRLIDAVKMVDTRMRSIRDGGRIAGVDRIAVMAALQIAHELIGSKDAPAAGVDTAASGELIRRIRKMSDDIEAEIKRQESLF